MAASKGAIAGTVFYITQEKHINHENSSHLAILDNFKEDFNFLDNKVLKKAAKDLKDYIIKFQEPAFYTPDNIKSFILFITDLLKTIAAPDNKTLQLWQKYLTNLQQQAINALIKSALIDEASISAVPLTLENLLFQKQFLSKEIITDIESFLATVGKSASQSKALLAQADSDYAVSILSASLIHQEINNIVEAINNQARQQLIRIHARYHQALDRTTLFFNGYCYGSCVAIIKHPKDFAEMCNNDGLPKLTDSVRYNELHQNVFATHPMSYQPNDANPLLYSLQDAGLQSLANFESFKEHLTITEDLVANSHLIIKLFSTNTQSGHAVSAWKANGNYFYWDSNYGLFSAKTLASFNALLKDMLGLYPDDRVTYDKVVTHQAMPSILPQFISYNREQEIKKLQKDVNALDFNEWLNKFGNFLSHPAPLTHLQIHALCEILVENFAEQIDTLINPAQTVEKIKSLLLKHDNAIYGTSYLYLLDIATYQLIFNATKENASFFLEATEKYLHNFANLTKHGAHIVEEMFSSNLGNVHGAAHKKEALETLTFDINTRKVLLEEKSKELKLLLASFTTETESNINIDLENWALNNKETLIRIINGSNSEPNSPNYSN